MNKCKSLNNLTNEKLIEKDKSYLNTLDKIDPNYKKTIINIIDTLDKKELPKNYNMLELSDFKSSMKSIIARDLLISRIGFILLSQDLADAFAKYLKGKKCLEIMCGSGALSKALQDRGIDIIPTDNFSWSSELVIDWNLRKNYWCDIENIDCIEAIEKYGQDIDYIIMSWPPYQESQATQALLKMREINKEYNKNIKLIYIGEGQCGCTADDEFFELLKVSNNMQEINNVYEKYYGIYDYICEIV